VRLTTTQVSLIAAAIALAAPAISYRANARLDRGRWVRERRSEAYIDALATLGRIAAHVTHPEGPTLVLPHEQWRVFQARVEAFASARVVALRNEFLTSWNGYRTQTERAAAASDQEIAATHSRQAEDYRADVRELYEALIAQVREELRQDSAPRWRRWLSPRLQDETRSP
jgi:hypothetical protein